MTTFDLNIRAQRANIIFHEASGGLVPVPLPPSFLPDRTKPNVQLSFTEAAARLTDCIIRVDHTGIIVPNDIPSSDWQKFTHLLAGHSLLVEYPDGVDDYDHRNARWLFVIPQSAEEHNTKKHLNRRRQPKFELVWDRGVDVPVLQIDMETRLTREEIVALFPGDQSHDIPGLGGIFRSVNVTLPFEGLRNGRLDLRYKDDGSLNDWNTAQMLLQQGTPVKPNGPATRLPGLGR